MDVIATGYVKNAGKHALELTKTLEANGREPYLLDVFREERKNYLFSKTLLTTSDHFSPVHTAEIELANMDKRDIKRVYTHSYGIVSILTTFMDADEYILIAPPLGTVKWKAIEKIFWFLPGFRELKNGSLQGRLFQRLNELKAAGKKVTIVISTNGADFGDDRVEYPIEIFNKMCDLTIVKTMCGIKHAQFMRDPEIVKRMIEET